MKVKKLNEDIQYCWFGYYVDRKGDKKYIYATKDSTSRDSEEGSKMLEDRIPEPYTKFVFCGTETASNLEKEGWTLVECKSINESMRPSQETLDDCLQDYLNNAFGYDGVEDYVDTQYPSHPQEFKSEIVNYLK